MTFSIDSLLDDEVHSLAASVPPGSRSFRDAALRPKVATLIDLLHHILFAGTGRKRPLTCPIMDNNHLVCTIDSPRGWEFAYEGGAHILFRHVLPHPRFVHQTWRAATNL
jgi:hypothetical protein